MFLGVILYCWMINFFEICGDGFLSVCGLVLLVESDEKCLR